MFIFDEIFLAEIRDSEFNLDYSICPNWNFQSNMSQCHKSFRCLIK